MRTITIILTEEDDPMPDAIYRTGVSLREAAMACYEAHFALWGQIPEMTDESVPEIGQPPA